MSNILVIDIGNTSTSVGLYRSGRVQRVRRMDSHGVTRMAALTLGREVVDGIPLHGAMVASVVPSATGRWQQVGRALAGRCGVVSHRTPLGTPISYPRPATIGPDRLANACGGVRKYGAPLIVADFGTAVTFDCISRTRGYIGGIIAPGLPLMFSYLAEKTALLPHIGVGATRSRVGRNTAEAMRLGARWGYRGMVREIIAELLRNPELRGARLVATGGYAGWVVQGLRPRMVVDPNLTLYGLGLAFEHTYDSH
jgi:type III pantothenate kinase